jgi:hypothetical protein
MVDVTTGRMRRRREEVFARDSIFNEGRNRMPTSDLSGNVATIERGTERRERHSSLEDLACVYIEINWLYTTWTKYPNRSGREKFNATAEVRIYIY